MPPPLKIAKLQVFEDLDFTLIEMNPFTLDQAGNPFPLDMRGELDDTAAFKSGKKCAALAGLHATVSLLCGCMQQLSRLSAVYLACR